MQSTPPTLLEKLRDPHDAAAWDRFIELYTGLLQQWARRLPLAGAEPDDLVQEVFVKLLHELPKFTYDPSRGRFRSWLRALCENHWRDRWKKRANRLVQAEPRQFDDLPARGDELEAFWSRDYHAHLARAAFRLLAEKFDPITRTAFLETVLNGRPAREVAQELGLTANALFIRKCRVMTRLRQVLAEFVD
jgi:RNA polymerase sigma-70 factor (ECF subfamily)